MSVLSSKLIGAGSATIALTGPGVGAGSIWGSVVSGISRNPFLRQELFSAAILGSALTEAIALFALMMAFSILFAF